MKDHSRTEEYKGTCQAVERKKARNSDRHSHPGRCRGRGLSGHEINVRMGGELTSWRAQREGHIRTWKKNWANEKQSRSGGTCQDMEIIRPGDGHSLPGDHVGTRKECDRESRTHFLETSGEGSVRTREERKRVTGTHKLDQRGTDCQDTKRKQKSEGYSLSGDHSRRRICEDVETT